MTEFGRIVYFKESYRSKQDNMSPVVTDSRGISKVMLHSLNSGKFYPYNLSNLEFLIADDSDLLLEFRSIKRNRDRKRLLYLYIEKYNERNPLYLPSNK